MLQIICCVLVVLLFVFQQFLWYPIVPKKYYFNVFFVISVVVVVVVDYLVTLLGIACSSDIDCLLFVVSCELWYGVILTQVVFLHELHHVYVVGIFCFRVSIVDYVVVSVDYYFGLLGLTCSSNIHWCVVVVEVEGIALTVFFFIFLFLGLFQAVSYSF